MTDWRYCKCGHQPNDHNPLSFACFLCDCDKWQADLEKSRQEGEARILSGKNQAPAPDTPLKRNN